MTTRQRFGSDLIATGMTHDSMGHPIDPAAIYDCREDGHVSRCGLDIKRKGRKNARA
jgi:hypothetical protein